MANETICPFCGQPIDLVARTWLFARSLLVIHLLRCEAAPPPEERMEAATKFADRVSRS